MKSNFVETAKKIILTYLGSELTFEGLRELYDIQSGDKEVLLRHIKALESIFTQAREDLENDLKGIHVVDETI